MIKKGENHRRSFHHINHSLRQFPPPPCHTATYHQRPDQRECARLGHILICGEALDAECRGIEKRLFLRAGYIRKKDVEQSEVKELVEVIVNGNRVGVVGGEAKALKETGNRSDAMDIPRNRIWVHKGIRKTFCRKPSLIGGEYFNFNDLGAVGVAGRVQQPVNFDSRLSEYAGGGELHTGDWPT